MKWSEQAWEEIEELYQRILNMPFITGLMEGSLPMDTFRFYLQQDAQYLEHFGRTLALIGAKADSVEEALEFMNFGTNAILVENALHESYFREYGITDKGVPEPACHHYIHYLKSTAAFESTEIGMAAVLPCFWIYKKVGDHISKHGRKIGNPYERWIETYSGEDFGISVKKAIDICDHNASITSDENRNKMVRAFVTASRLEYDFWDGAYVKRQWI